MKREPATSEYEAFKSLLNRIMAVPHSELVKREVAYQKQSALNPSRPGPKPQKKRRRVSRVRSA